MFPIQHWILKAEEGLPRRVKMVKTNQSQEGMVRQNFKVTLFCWNCDKRGNFTNWCKAPKKNKTYKNKKRDDDESVNATADEFDDALICSLDSPVDSWVMDLGASFHTTPSKDLLSNYISRRFGKVYLADGISLDIVGRGNIDIKTSSGSLWTLHNVRHIPALKRNLISIGRLDDEGEWIGNLVPEIVPILHISP